MNADILRTEGTNDGSEVPVQVWRPRKQEHNI